MTFSDATNWSAVVATFTTVQAATPTPTSTATPTPAPTPTPTPTPIPTPTPTPTPTVTATPTPTAIPTPTPTSAPTPNPFALVQSAAVQGTGVTSVSAGFSSSNTAGNLIIAFVRMSTANQTVTVTDSNGNAYTDAVAQAQTTDGHQVHIFYAPNVAG